MGCPLIEGRSFKVRALLDHGSAVLSQYLCVKFVRILTLFASLNASVVKTNGMFQWGYTSIGWDNLAFRDLNKRCCLFV